MNWTDVRGWLTEADGQKLQELAAGKTVLELGSSCGRSTCAIDDSINSLGWEVMH
jgi:hypothetical protein